MLRLLIKNKTSSNFCFIWTIASPCLQQKTDAQNVFFFRSSYSVTYAVTFRTLQEMLLVF